MGSFAYIRSLPKRYTIGALVVIAALIIGWHFLRSPASVTDTVSTVAHVHISSVAGLSSQSGPLPVVGKVTSESQANILAQSSGEIVSLSRALGDRVVAGQVIASFESSSQQAALLQAEGSYDAAEAALAKTSGTSAQNSSVTSAQAAQAAQNAQVAASSALTSAYASLDDAVHNKADALFSNPRTTPQLLFQTSDGQIKVNVENERTSLDQQLASVESLGADTAPADTEPNIAKMIAKAQVVESFLADLTTAVNKAIPGVNASASQISAYQTSVSAARSEVIAAVSSLTSAKSAYDSALSGAATAANSAGSGSQNDIASAEASVKQALGALDAAKANLEKTVVRSPISGTIVSLPVHRGDFVSSFAQVAQVSNPGALYIDTSVTPDDAKTLTVGNKAEIEGSIAGVITFVAPALDPITNKIEVKVGITGSQTSLTDNDTVTVTLDRGQSASSAGAHAAQGIVIPIVATKITPQGPLAFTVSASSTLVALPITLGPILGDQITVLSGLTPESDIVTDARGLSAGESVVVDTN